MLNSISENVEKQWSGLCFSKKAPKSIRATCKINFVSENVNCRISAPLYSPLLKNIEIVKYGSNKLRNKLNYIPEMDLSAARL